VLNSRQMKFIHFLEKRNQPVSLRKLKRIIVVCRKLFHPNLHVQCCQLLIKLFELFPWRQCLITLLWKVICVLIS